MTYQEIPLLNYYFLDNTLVVESLYGHPSLLRKNVMRSKSFTFRWWCNVAITVDIDEVIVGYTTYQDLAEYELLSIYFNDDDDVKCCLSWLSAMKVDLGNI